MRSLPLARPGLLLPLLLLLACADSPTHPSGGSPIWLGVEGQLSGSQQRDYGFSVDTSALVELTLQATSGAVVATVTAAGGQLLGSARAGGTQPDSTSVDIRITASCGCDVAIRSDPAVNGGQAAYRVKTRHILDAPEIHPSAIAVGDSVLDETLADIYDVDGFTFPGRAGQEVALRFEGPGAAAVAFASVIAPGSDSAVLAVAVPAQYRTAPTWPRVTLPVTGTYKILVRYTPEPWAVPAQPQAPYAFWLYGVDRAPESGPADLPDSTLVAGALEIYGDIDELHFPAAAGDRFTVDLAAPASAAGGGLRRVVLDPAGVVLDDVAIVPTADSAAAAFSRYLYAAQSGTYTVRIEGTGLQHDPVAYTLFRHLVDPDPERAPRVLVAGDSVREDFAGPSDIDQFVLQRPDSSYLSLSIRTDSVAENVRFVVGDSSLRNDFVHTPGTRYWFRSFEPGVGDTLVASSIPGNLVANSIPGYSYSGPRYVGGYVIHSYWFTFAPEDGPAVLQLRDSVVESMVPLSDYDTFRLEQGSADTVFICVDAMGLPGGSNFSVYLSKNFAPPILALDVPSYTPPGQPVCGRTALPDPGPWDIIAWIAGSMGPDPYYSGKYRITVGT